jgi:hypothetical protein
MKLLARDDVRRPQDAADLIALRPRLDAHEVEAARQACRLIESRGLARGKHLSEALEAWLGTVART